MVLVGDWGKRGRERGRTRRRDEERLLGDTPVAGWKGLRGLERVVGMEVIVVGSVVEV